MVQGALWLSLLRKFSEKRLKLGRFQMAASLLASGSKAELNENFIKACRWN